jgi:hypothetical protein
MKAHIDPACCGWLHREIIDGGDDGRDDGYHYGGVGLYVLGGWQITASRTDDWRRRMTMAQWKRWMRWSNGMVELMEAMDGME